MEGRAVSYEMIQRAWEIIRDGDYNLTTAEVIMLLAIADRHNNKTGHCLPSVASLARERRLSDRTMHRTLDRLSKRGVIQVTMRWSGFRQTSRQYDIIGSGHLGDAVIIDEDSK